MKTICDMIDIDEKRHLQTTSGTTDLAASYQVKLIHVGGFKVIVASLYQRGEKESLFWVLERPRDFPHECAEYIPTNP